MKNTHWILPCIAAMSMPGLYALANAAEPLDRHKEIQACKLAYAKSAKDQAAEARFSACLARIRFDGDLAKYAKKRNR